jgi:hypothetical protein
MIVSDPNREINYEILRKYLHLYCYYLDLLKLKCKVSLQLGFLKCLGCNLLFKPESQQYIALDCQKHAFDSLECAKKLHKFVFIQHFRLRKAYLPRMHGSLIPKFFRSSLWKS